ncbi:Cruciform DNA binding protein [Exophiala xenobiotica]|uniref:Cruciform DNA binding protein n=1 Tax=Lithohypha guttulata TaxID=1690604 RepID=A0ABR0KFA1_9EURO|nr:Cruciform DNA binding protein [Lithohypha guttulata]KAK5312070.1 Cruciform DNA binding protein [Exophiala xenobiotica]
MGSFLFRWPYRANHVYVTGTFDDWGKSERLERVDGGFEKEVELPNAEQKIYYKFVVDDQWIVDTQAPKEDDGHYNVNNVLLPHQIRKSAPTVSAGGQGAPLLTKEQSEANLARPVPHVTPDPNRPVTRSLSQNDGAAESRPEETDRQPEELDDDIPGAFPQTPANEPSSFSVAPIPATGHQNTQSSVTTSKEDYESAGGEGMAAGASSSQPVNADIAKGTAADQGTAEGGFSTQPVNADLAKNATTSKEDYEKVGSEGADDEQVSVNPLPATGHDNTQSSVTTSREDYEKAGAFGMAGLAVAGGGAALASAFSKPQEDEKNMIPESSLPINPEKTDTIDTGPFMSSAGPGTTTAELASQVPLEPKREAQVIDPSAPEAPEASKEASATPFMASSGPGTTTADLASQVSLEPKREAQTIDPSAPEAPEASKEASATPFMASSGPGTTTADLASQVPVEQERQGVTLDDETITEKSEVEKELLQQVPESQATGEPASAANSQIPVGLQREGVEVDEEIAAEKSELEKELLQKVPESQATGEPASAAQAQTSHYGLASNIPQPVEDSIAEAHASPEAATETSAVAEKTAMERELQASIPRQDSAGESAPNYGANQGADTDATATHVPQAVENSIAQAHASPEAAAETSAVAGKSAMEQELKASIPVEESAGEPAPTLSAALATTAPGEPSTAATATAAPDESRTAAATVDDLTGGITANEPVPDTDTSNQDRSLTTGEIAGGAAVGGAAAASAFALATRHGDKDIEPSRLDDSQKPPVTTEAAPAAVLDTTEPVSNRTASAGSPSPHPGVNPMAGAALSDGTEDPTVADEPFVSRSKAPVETSEATATEYAPPRIEGMAPGVSPSAAAALSDGCEDPTLSEERELSEEPAVKMMAQNAAADIAPTSSALGTTSSAAPTSEVPTGPVPSFYSAITSPATTTAAPTSDTTSRDATLSPTTTSPATGSAAPISTVTTTDPEIPSQTTSAGTTTGVASTDTTLPPTTAAPLTTSTSRRISAAATTDEEMPYTFKAASPISAATTTAQTAPSASPPAEMTAATSTSADMTAAATSAPSNEVTSTSSTPADTTAATTSTTADMGKGTPSTPAETTTARTSAPAETATNKDNEGQLTPAAAETAKMKEREPSSATDRDPSPMTRPAGGSSAAGQSTETPKKTGSRPAAAGTTPSSVSSTPSASGDGEKKKKNRLSRIFKKIFD